MSTPSRPSRTTDDFASLARRLSDELRRHIGALRIVPHRGGGRVERQERQTMLARLNRVAAIVEGERVMRMRDGGGGGKESHHGSSGGTSLWEDGEELALRFLLEGAKVNLLLRLLEDHVDGILKARVETWVDEDSSNSSAGVDGADRDAAGLRLGEGGQWLALERSLSILVPSVWAHREGVQVTDLNIVGTVLARGMLTVLGLLERGGGSGNGSGNGSGSGSGSSSTSPPPPYRPALVTLLLRLLGALGGPACLGAVGDKLVAALSRAGVFPLLPLFLLAVGDKAMRAASTALSAAITAAAVTSSEPGSSQASRYDPVALVYGDVALYTASTSLSPTSSGGGASSGGVGGVGGGLPPLRTPPGASSPSAAAAHPVSPLDLLRGAGGVAAIMALESFAATVKPELHKEADTVVGRLAEEAGHLEGDSDAPVLLALGARGVGLELRLPHWEACARLKKHLLEGLLGDPGVVRSLDGGGGARGPCLGGGLQAKNFSGHSWTTATGWPDKPQRDDV